MFEIYKAMYQNIRHIMYYIVLIKLNGLKVIIFCFYLTHTQHRNLYLFYFHHIDWFSKGIIILKIDFNLLSNLLEIVFPTFMTLILTSFEMFGIIDLKFT